MTAITYDSRVGTSISTSASRSKYNTAAIQNSELGTIAIIIRIKLEGIWLNTIVFTKPNRFASLAAHRYEHAFRTRPQKNSNAIMPKSVIITPEILLIHSNHRAVNFPRSKLMPLVKMHHHKIEPLKTPNTTSAAET